jgi:flagellar hook assembly protein FlgD/outer membrane protein OmpA-like peptidoglycan-associated protein
MRRIPTIIALLIASVPLFAVNLLPGSQLFYLGYGPSETALGYTGISELGSISGNAWNPASSADLRRIANTVDFSGVGSADFLGSLGFFMPTVGGVCGINLEYFNTNWAPSTMQIVGGTASFAKQITADLYWGADLTYRQGFFGSVPDWQLSLDTGVIVGSKTSETGIGILDPFWGVVLKNLGKPINPTGFSPLTPVTVGAGFSFYPVRFEENRLKLSADLAVPVYPFNVTLGIGLENVIYDIFSIRLGYTLAGTNYGLPGVGLSEFPLMVGAGINFKVRVNHANTNHASFIDLAFGRSKLEDSTDVDLSWALQNQNFNGQDEWANSIKLSVAWGYYDDQPPVISAVADTNWFSPNFDGVQDKVRIALAMRDNIMVNGWTFEILSNGTPVRNWRSVDRLAVRKLTFEKFFSQLLSVKSEVEIPKELVWDGFDDTGKVVPDGEYQYVLTAWDENGNSNRTVPATLNVDTVVPVVSLKPDYLVFSTNAVSNRSVVHIAVASSNIQPSDSVSAVLLDSNGTVVRNWDFTAACPDEIDWNGLDSHSNLAPEGAYSFRISVRNPAGNSAKAELQKIALVTHSQTAAISVSRPIFSPVSDGDRNSIILSPMTSDPTGLVKYRVVIQDSASNIVRQFTGSNELPKEIVWSGENQAGKKLPDGIYRFRLELAFDCGTMPVSDWGQVEIDTVPPTVVIHTKYLAFAPGTGGVQDSLPFDLKWNGRDEDVYETKVVDSLGYAVYYDRFTRKDAPSNFVWNGLDKNFNTLPEGRYTYIISGSDEAGNHSVSQVKDIFLKNGRDKATLLADVAAFSPGSTNAIPKAVLTASVSSTNELTNYLLEVANSNGSVVRSWHTNAFLTVAEWDGKDDKGVQVPDGFYQYQLHLAYTYDPNVKSAARTVKVDTVPPTVSAKADDWIFSPNGDGRKETFAIHLNAVGDSDDVFDAAFADSLGKPVRSFRWTGKAPSDLVWDGRDDLGNPAPEGIYFFHIVGADSAQNRAEATIPEVKLVRTFETLAFAAMSNSFTPSQGALCFTGALSSTNDILRSEMSIRDAQGNPVRLFRQDRGFNGIWNWDGKSDQGTPLPDGSYSAQLTAEFESGNLITTNVIGILLGNGAPGYRLSLAPDVFTPDGDGENDTLFIHLEVSNFIGVKDWKLTVYRKNDDGTKGPAFKHWNGTGNTNLTISWDGLGDDTNDSVESVQDYTLELQAVDLLGNRVTNAEKPLSVGVLVDRTPDGIRIRVSSIQFEVNTPNMIGNSQKNLDKVIFIIRKILADRAKYGLPDNAKIEISGHADDTGEDLTTPDGRNFNDWLSEQRAKAVYSYFLDKDIDPKLLEYVGYGSKRPYKIIDPAMSIEKKRDYRQRNRRVEFFIRK